MLDLLPLRLGRVAWLWCSVSDMLSVFSSPMHWKCECFYLALLVCAPEYMAGVCIYSAVSADGTCCE